MNTPALALLTTILLTASGEELAVHHQADAEITRHFRHRCTLTLDDMSAIIEGEEMPMPGDIEEERTTSFDILLRDTIEKVDGDRPLRFTRNYEKLSGKETFSASDPMMGEIGHDIAKVCDLEGREVMFAAEDDDYTASFPGQEDGDEELLERLTTRLDLEGFLPDAPVEQGDEWKVDPSVLLTLLAPGGDLPMTVDGGDGSVMPEGEITDVSGGISAKFVGVREEDGVRLAAIALTVDVSTLKDLTTTLGGEIGVPDDELPEGTVIPDVELAEQETLHVGKGLLLWNLERGMLDSIELECDVTQTETMEMSLGDMPPMEQVTYRSGTEEFEVRFDV